MFGIFRRREQHQEIVSRLDYLQRTVRELRSDIRSFSREIRRSSEMENEIMVNLRDLQSKADEELSLIRADTDLVNAVKKVVDNQNAKIDSLRTQVKDLIESGGGSAEELQRLSDTLDAIRSAETSQREVVSAAVIAGTSAEDGSEGPSQIDTSGNSPAVRTEENAAEQTVNGSESEDSADAEARREDRSTDTGRSS